MSFNFDISEKDLASSIFMERVHKKLVKAALAARATGITQAQLAKTLGTDKSSISRILSGRGNPTARTIGELAWALGVEFDLVEINGVGVQISNVQRSAPESKGSSNEKSLLNESQTATHNRANSGFSIKKADDARQSVAR